MFLKACSSYDVANDLPRARMEADYCRGRSKRWQWPGFRQDQGRGRVDFHRDSTACDVFSCVTRNNVLSALRIQTGRFEEKMAKDVFKMLRWQEGCTMIRPLEGKMGKFTASLDLFQYSEGKNRTVLEAIIRELSPHINKESTELPRGGKNTEVLEPELLLGAITDVMTFSSNDRQLRNGDGRSREKGGPRFVIGMTSPVQN